MFKPSVRDVRARSTQFTQRSRRGVAMMLVIIAMGIATVLSTTYLASRSNSETIGENVASAAKSGWSAKAAADIGVAILQTNLNWRAAVAADGTLISNEQIAGGNVTVSLTNLSGLPPVASDRELVMTVTSTVNGVSSTVQKLVTVTPDATVASAVDTGLNEFTLFATNSLNIAADGAVGIWGASPEALSPRPAKIGVNFTSISSYTVDPAAAITKGALYVPPDAALSLKDQVTAGQFTGGLVLPVRVPAASSLTPAAFAVLPPALPADVTFSGQTLPLLPASYQNVNIKDGSVITIDAANGDLYAFDDLKIEKGSVLVIKGAVKLLVRDDFRVKSASAIEFGSPDASVAMIAYDNVTIEDSSIGFDRSVGFNKQRSRNDPLPYASPARFTIVGMDRPVVDADDADDAGEGDFDPGETTSTKQDIKIAKNALVIASIHAPEAKVKIEDGSTLFGRASGRRVEVKKNGMILGDPTLDPGAGFTEPDSPLYDANGAPVAGLAAALATIAAANGAMDLADAQQLIIDTINANAPPVPPAGPLPPSAGTPRKQKRAKARDWPKAAMAMEEDAASGASNGNNGDFLGVNGSSSG